MMCIFSLRVCAIGFPSNHPRGHLLTGNACPAHAGYAIPVTWTAWPRVSFQIGPCFYFNRKHSATRGAAFERCSIEQPAYWWTQEGTMCFEHSGDCIGLQSTLRQDFEWTHKLADERHKAYLNLSLKENKQAQVGAPFICTSEAC